MALARALSWLATVVVVLTAALAVPVSQLRTVRVDHSCCCPKPESCHCPDHEPGAPADGAALRACHKSQRVTFGPQAPELRVAQALALSAPRPVVAAIVHALPAPHAPPSPDRPRGPS